MKQCTKCKLMLPLKDFIIDKRRKDGKGSTCRPCHKTFASMQSKVRTVLNCKVCDVKIVNGRADKDYCSDKCGHYYRNAKYRLKRYNITPEEYFLILKSQGYVCAICKQAESMTGRISMIADHCHKSNRFRGILCHRCNTALGLFKDDISRLETAIQYLRKCSE